MTPRLHGNILAFKTFEGRVLGFHRENLELAELSEALWSSLNGLESSGEAMDELSQWSLHQSSEVRPGDLAVGVRSLTINITQICNLHCTYCAAGGDGSYGDPMTRIAIDKTLPQLRKFLNETPDGEEFTIHFLGGEPLLYPKGIRALAEYAQLLVAGRQLKLQFALTTNGTLLSNENLQLLAELNCHLSISIDGPAAITDRMRPSKNKTSTTTMILEGLERLKTYRNSLGSLGFSAVFDAMNTDVLAAYKFFRDIDVDYYEFTFSHTEKSDEASRAFMEQMEQVFAEAYNHGGERELRKIRSVNHYLTQLENQQRTHNFCGAGKSFLMIDSRNNLYTCPWVVGDAKEQVGAGDQINDEALKPFLEDQINHQNCQSCWAKYLCGGGCSYEHKMKTGNKGEKSLQFCERTRHFLMLVLVYFEKLKTQAG